MAKFQLTNKAIDDLSSIWNYTFDKWSESQADKYYGELLEGCKRISENPSSGKNYKGIRKSLLGFKINKHIIFYHEIAPEKIEIARILHEKMDLKRKRT